MNHHSLNSVSPFLRVPDARRKAYAKIGGNGRAPGRGGHPIQLTLTQLPATPPPPVARVGERTIGSYVCPACHTRTSTLVRQLPGSSHLWVCHEWCSPRNPRMEPFVSTTRTNMEDGRA